MSSAKVWPEGDTDCVVDVDNPWGDPSDAAQAACEVFWSEHDGWEWLKTEAVLFVEQDGTITRHSISVDFSPSFYASIGDEVTPEDAGVERTPAEPGTSGENISPSQCPD
jgi:hypothetical protein